MEVASLADTTLVLLAPGMGDAIQAVKAGILEIADVFVVNKADRDGADATVRDIQGMIALGERGPGQWRPQVVRTVASRGEGIDDIVGRDRQAPRLAGRARRAARAGGSAGRRRGRGDRARHAPRPDRRPARRYGAAGARRRGGRRASWTRTPPRTGCCGGWTARAGPEGSGRPAGPATLPGMATTVAPGVSIGIAVAGVSVAYGRADPVLRDVSVDAVPGRVLAVTGPPAPARRRCC